MAVVDVAIAAGTALGVGGGGVAAGLVGGAAIGAGAGALYSGVTGDGNILNSALTGALIGGGVGAGGAALGLTGATGTSLGLSGAGALSGVGSSLGLAGATPEVVAGTANTPALASAALNAPAYSGASSFGSAGGASIPAAGVDAVPSVVQGAAPVASTVATDVGGSAINPATDLPWESTGSGLTSNGAAVTAKDLADASAVGQSTGLSGKELLGYGLAGTTALSLLGSMNRPKLQAGVIPGQNPAMIRPQTYSVSQNQAAYPTGPQYGANGLPILPTKEQNYFNQSYTAGTPYKAADGGLMAAPPTPGLMDGGTSGNVDFMGGDMYPTSQQHRSYYATPTQAPTTAQEVMASYEPKTNPLTGELTANMADGGYTYDAVNQKYNPVLPQGVGSYESMVPMGFGLGATQFANLGQPEPGGPFAGGFFGGGENIGFQPASKLDPQSLAAMTAQWQSQNPNKRTYDPTTQKYGYATPDQNTLLAMKNAQDMAAYQAQQQAQQPSGGDSGGGANGGLMPYNLGSYSDGGRLLKGPGDGVSDDIPAVIGQKQPARLADGEFVVPARIVSELGNGSTDAGAKRLYAMMDRIQEGRKKTVGKDKVAVNSKADKHLPA